MTWLLASGVIVALGVIATLAIALIVFTKKAIDRGGDVTSLVAEKAEQSSLILKQAASIADQHDVILTLQDEIERERNARRKVTKHAEHLLEKLEAAGNPDGMAAGIRDSLERLRSLHEDMPDMPDVPAPDNGDSADAVHGTDLAGDQEDG